MEAPGSDLLEPRNDGDVHVGSEYLVMSLFNGFVLI